VLEEKERTHGGESQGSGEATKNSRKQVRKSLLLRQTCGEKTGYLEKKKKQNGGRRERGRRGKVASAQKLNCEEKPFGLNDVRLISAKQGWRRRGELSLTGASTKTGLR